MDEIFLIDVSLVINLAKVRFFIKRQNNVFIILVSPLRGFYMYTVFLSPPHSRAGLLRYRTFGTLLLTNTCNLFHYKVQTVEDIRLGSA